MAVVKAKGRKSCYIKLKVDGRWVRFPGVKDRGTSEAIEGRIVRLIHARTHHQPVPAEVLTWLQDIPTRAPRLYAHLVQHGLADSTLRGRQPLTDLLFGKVTPRPGFAERAKLLHRNGNKLAQAERKVRVLHPELYDVASDEGGYFQSLLAAGTTSEHVLQATGRIETALKGCAFNFWEDFNAERLKQWLHRQRSIRDDFGVATSNHYIKAMRAFAGWCKDHLKRLAEANPFEGMELMNDQADVRRKRRVATVDELEKLVRAAEGGGDVAGLNGIDRAMLYRVVSTVALRAGECASLTPESFIHQENGVTVRVAAAYSKHRREDNLPVPASLWSALSPWMKKKPAGERLWPGSWHEDAAAMLRVDLEAAGIPYQADDGSYFDFHATRHTGITRGSKVMQIDQLRRFARHSKIEMTMRYVHTDADELRERADRLLAPGCRHGDSPSGGRMARAEECDHERDHGCGSKSQRASSRRIESHSTRNDTSPCGCKSLSSIDTVCHQRGRRGSNPQPPDRQSGTLTN